MTHPHISHSITHTITPTITRTALSLTLLAALSACGGGGDEATPAVATTQSVSIDFDIVAGTTPVRCGTLVNSLGTTSVSAQPKDLRYYVSGIQLLKADGSAVPLTLGANDDWNLTSGSHTLSLIDLENASGACPASTGTPATHSRITGTVPTGTYTGIAFEMGVPAALNHTDTVTAPKPLDIPGMAWSWQSGRKMAKVEVTDPDGTTGTWASKTFNFHLGSTGCTGNPVNGEIVSCVAPNRVAVKLASFNPSTQKIAFDLSALVAGENVTVNGGGATGCMSGGTDPECDTVFAALDLSFGTSATGLPLSGGVNQTVFKALAK